VVHLGYKLRKHISNAIVRRSAAVRAAIDHYNELAPLQNPPCSLLQYTDVASYGWLGDFILLKISRHDILQKPWANSANREVARRYFKLLRAKEEIYRLNIEVRRLQAWIDEEDTHILQCADEQLTLDPLLAATIREQYLEQKRVNDVHRARLRAIYILDGYSGAVPSIPMSSEGGGGAEVDDMEGVDLDRVHNEVHRLADCLDAISV